MTTPAAPQGVELFGKMSGRGEERREFHRDGDGDAGLDRLEDVEGALLHRDARFVRIGGDVIDVEFERVGPGLLDEAGVVGPAADADAVERADDRDIAQDSLILEICSR